MVEFTNQTLIIQIQENVMNLVDYEHPVVEPTDDQKQKTYFSDSEQPPPLNTMLGPPLEVYSGKAFSGSE